MKGTPMLHTAKRQSGSSVMVVIFALLIVAVIGISGWYVWYRAQPFMNRTTTTVTPAYLTYRNVVYNFQFSYPRSWGEARVDTVSGQTTANAYEISFDTKLGGFFSDSSWKPVADSSAPSPAKYTACSGAHVYIAYASTGICVAVLGTNESTPGTGPENVATIIIQKQLINSKAPALIFTMAPTAGYKDLSTSSLKQAFTRDSSSPAYLYLAKSIKPLR